MLLGMKSTVEACRALALYAAYQLDLGAAHPDEAVRAAAQARGDLLIPIVKGFCTECGIEVASIGIQVHGGMGYIEETGAAQTFRDVRITVDLRRHDGHPVERSHRPQVRARPRRRAAARSSTRCRQSLAALAPLHASARCIRAARRSDALARLRKRRTRCSRRWRRAPDRAMAVSVPFLKLCGLTIGGWLMARAADIAAQRLAAGASDREFLEAKLASAHFYAAQVLPQVLALEQIVHARQRCRVGNRCRR